MKNTKKLSGISLKVFYSLYRTMLKIRRFEEKIIELYPAQDMKTPVHLYIGQEAIAAGVCANLRRDDYVFSNHRGHGHYIAKGGDLGALVAEFYGRSGGCSKGKGGSMHIVAPEAGIMGTSAIVGGGISHAVGAALASVLQENKRVSVAFFGDGAADTGVFYESINFASLKKLPVVFVCENNFYATNSPLKARHPLDNIYRRGETAGVWGIRVDGNDVVEVFRVVKESVRRAREGQGPTLIECRTYRWMQHVGPQTDFQKGYRLKEELDFWKKKCPIKRFQKVLLKEGIFSQKDIEKIDKQVKEEIEKAVIFGRRSPFPGRKDLYKDIYKDAVV